MTEAAVLSRTGLDELIAALIADGYRVIGPTRRDDAIVLAELDSGAQLPSGWGVDSGPGRYRLRRRTDEAVFGHSAGSQSWKEFLHPPQQLLWSADGDGFSPARPEPAGRRSSACGPVTWPRSPSWAWCSAAGRAPTVRSPEGGRGCSWSRRGAPSPGGVCFCASMGTGPRPGPGYDLALTERIDSGGHRFIVEVGSVAGERVLSGLTYRGATGAEVDEARDTVEAAAAHMGRQMPGVDLRQLRDDSRESPLWADVADRCLTCGNCTMVCPTCFCTTTEDSTDLTGEHAQRSQRWASCFEADFSYLHGGSVQASGASRYRQWITHKLSTWHGQFGSSGCVGCGRCIAWCPVGIDITAEAANLAELRDASAAGEDEPEPGEQF